MLTSARARRRRRAVARPSAHLVLPRRKSVPLACSGLMYGAVPRMIPACFMAGTEVVGDSD